MWTFIRHEDRVLIQNLADLSDRDMMPGELLLIPVIKLKLLDP
jgi:hypothetical protein